MFSKVKPAVRRVRRHPRYVAVESRIGGLLIYLVLWALRATTRFEVHGLERLEPYRSNGRPVVLAFWHGRSIMLPFVFLGRRATIMNSTHRDGELITRALERFGFSATRGSSRRGAVAGTLGLLRVLRRGGDVALIPDGPRGPAGVARAGAVELAAAARAPLFPLAFSARPCLRLPSWDRMMIPMPGARVACVVGEPMEPSDTGRDRRERLRMELEQRLADVTRAADRLAGRPEEAC